ncbi:MAG: ATP-binding cassette domain-containing protein [Planctomycetaceae bacterium]
MQTPEPEADVPLLEVSQLSYQYPGGLPALDCVSIDVRVGESLGIVGPSGAGKSTLLQHLNGLLPNPSTKDQDQPSCVRVAELNATRGNLARIRQMVGLMFQDPDDQLFCSSVWDDVAFGPRNLNLASAAVNQRVRESLRAVGLEELGNRSVLQLSFGERKRVCLAGVLACRPQVLALDEPSANLDPRSRRQLMSIIADFPGTRIVATHDLDLVARLCRRVIVLDSGRVCADGLATDILSDESLMLAHGLEVPLSLGGGGMDADHGP